MVGSRKNVLPVRARGEAPDARLVPGPSAAVFDGGSAAGRSVWKRTENRPPQCPARGGGRDSVRCRRTGRSEQHASAAASYLGEHIVRNYLSSERFGVMRGM